MQCSSRAESNYFSQILIDVVEIDSEMLSVSEKWFEFSQGDKVKVFIEDGVEFIKQACIAGKKGLNCECVTVISHH